VFNASLNNIMAVVLLVEKAGVLGESQ